MENAVIENAGPAAPISLHPEIFTAVEGMTEPDRQFVAGPMEAFEADHIDT